jgi:hypothetical protein
LFVTLHKSGDVSASTAYEDSLIDTNSMVWYSRSKRTTQSSDTKPIVENSVDLHVFAKKDDAEGSDFYYLGQATSTNAVDTTMSAGDGKPLSVVRMELRFSEPIQAALFDYFHTNVADGF